MQSKVTVSVRILQRNTTNRIYLANLNSKGQAGRLETQAGSLCYSLEAEFLLRLETSVFALGVFNKLDKAHSHYGR